MYIHHFFFDFFFFFFVLEIIFIYCRVTVSKSTSGNIVLANNDIKGSDLNTNYLGKLSERLYPGGGLDLAVTKKVTFDSNYTPIQLNNTRLTNPSRKSRFTSRSRYEEI